MHKSGGLRAAKRLFIYRIEDLVLVVNSKMLIGQVEEQGLIISVRYMKKMHMERE